MKIIGVRYVKPVRPWRAKGWVAEVYRDIRREFGLLGDFRNGRSPYLAHSPVPELVAAMWSVHYETMLVGDVPRADKEAVATAVSASNGCRFCADVHTVMASTAGPAPGRLAELTAWGKATRSPDSPLLAHPPFAEHEVPEMVGTVLCFHYVNRVVEVFLGPKGVMPASTALRRPVEGFIGTLTRRAMGRTRRPGQSLCWPPYTGGSWKPDLDWAAPAPHIATAFAQMGDAVEQAAEPALTEPVRGRVSAALGAWRGADPGPSRSWLEDELTGLDASSSAVARLALLTALAPYQVTPDDVAAFRSVHPDDRDLVAVVAWSAFQAAARIGQWLVPTTRRPRPPIRSAGES